MKRSDYLLVFVLGFLFGLAMIYGTRAARCDEVVKSVGSLTCQVVGYESTAGGYATSYASGVVAGTSEGGRSVAITVLHEFREGRDGGGRVNLSLFDKGLWVVIPKPPPYRATVTKVGNVENLDIAVLEFQATQRLFAARIDWRLPSNGDVVQRIGYPNGHKTTDKATGRVTGFDGQSCEMSAPTVQGGSGSPVFGMDSRVVGIVWGSNDASSYFTPAARFKQLFETASRSVCGTSGCYQYAPQYQSQNRVVVRQPLLPYRRRAAANSDALAIQQRAQGAAIARQSQASPPVRQPINNYPASDMQQIKDRLAALESRPTAPGPRGPAGFAGKDGKDGATPVVDYARLAEAVREAMPPIVVENYDAKRKLVERQEYQLGTPIKLQYVKPIK